MADKVAVLIPCYNEAVTIGKVVDDFKRVLPDADIYVYDNNSKDGTADIAREHGAIVKFEGRQGKGNVVRSMFRDIDADYYRLSNGSYGEENDRAFHGFGNDLVRWLIKKIYGFAFDDVMTGYRAFNRVFVKTMPVLSEGFQIETEISIHAVDKRWRIEDVPIDYRDRPEGSYSKLSTFGDGAKVLRAITSLFKDYRPLAFFGWLALLLLVLAVVAGIPVVAEYAETGLVPRIPTMLGSLALAGCGALSFVTGLILDTVAKSHRRQWEIDVYKAMNGFYRE